MTKAKLIKGSLKIHCIIDNVSTSIYFECYFTKKEFKIWSNKCKELKTIKDYKIINFTILDD
jgi:hypothetical protein